MQRKREHPGQSGKKRKFIRGKREGDCPLRRTSILPFCQSLSYTSPMKNSLKGSCSWRSGIWWSRSFEKVGTSEITGCHLDNLVSLTDHCDLFFVCEVDIWAILSMRLHVGPVIPAFLIYNKGRRSIFCNCFLWDRGVMGIRQEKAGMQVKGICVGLKFW